jgi:hypothetical protein
MNCYESEVRLLFSRERADLLANEMRAARHAVARPEGQSAARGIDDFSVRAGTG